MSICAGAERRQVQRYLGRPRHTRTAADAEWLFELMRRYDTVDFARRSARQLAGAALVEALKALRPVPDSPDKQFILDLVMYVVNRDR